jgi:hypothetical protein
MKDPFAQSDAPRLMIFGHPGHELALFGLLKRHQPEIIVITDGGAPERLEQSRRGLGSIGLQDRVRYLGFSESSFYEALLNHDVKTFQKVVDVLQAEIQRVEPKQVFCDAVEFYNPVHDITLPMVMAASVRLFERELFEVPLVYQVPSTEEQYVVQRVPGPLRKRVLTYELTSAELRQKMQARDEIYLNLKDQLGPDFLGITAEHLGHEEIAPAGDPLVAPGETGRAMRYEWRANVLLKAGQIQRAITHRDHYVPMVNALLSL